MSLARLALPWRASNRSARDRDVAAVVTSIVVGLAFGVLTAYAQGWLPEEMGPLANSSGSWAMIAFLLALLAGRAASASICSALALLALLGGYVLGAELRSISWSTTLVAFWGLAALVAGPLLGLAAHWTRAGDVTRAALGIAAVTGVLVGEGIYGLTEIADTTYGPYWVVQIIVGVVLLVVVAARRLRSVRPIGVAVITTVGVAIAFVLLYRADLITLL